MRGQQVMEIKNLPEWASIHDTRMHPPTSPGSNNFSDLTVAQYIKRFQEDGSIGEEASALFTEVLQGQVSTSAVLTVSKQNIQKASSKMESIKIMLQEMIGDAGTIEVAMWPEIEEDEEPPNANETLFSQAVEQQEMSDLRAEIQNIKEGILELNEVAKILLEFRAEMTAPLTSVASPTGTTVSSLSDAVEKAVYNGMEKAQSEGGILHEKDQKKAMNMMTKMGHVMDISENDSIIKQEWNKLADENFHSMQLLAQRPVNLVPIAIFQRPVRGAPKVDTITNDYTSHQTIKKV
jgi:hypothetical protein